MRMNNLLRAGSAAAIFACAVGPRIMLAPEGGAGGGATDDRDLAQLAVDLKAATDEVKTFAEKANTEIKNLGKVTDETKESADKALVEMNGITLRLTDVEQKLARRSGPSGQSEFKSAGEIVAESEEYKAASPRGDAWKGSFRVEVKAITSASASGASSSTALVPADRQAGLIELPRRSLTVRDLLAPGRTMSASIEYARELVFTNSAASVAENPSVAKPESNITFQLVNSPVRTIAHWVPASKQILADAPQLQSVIDGRLRYGLAYREDEQLLLGAGTGTDLTGLMTVATAYAAPAGITVTNPTKIDKLRLAMLQATLALYPATGHVLHPTDWADIELTKDTEGRYIWANPAGLVGPTLWGLPVAQSMAMPQNSFLTGALRYAAQIFDREDADVLLSTEDRDNFVKNMVTILCEERLALAIYRPQALIKGTFVVV